LKNKERSENKGSPPAKCANYYYSAHHEVRIVFLKGFLMSSWAPRLIILVDWLANFKICIYIDTVKLAIWWYPMGTLTHP
jgi:hypothetical protein